MTYKAILVHVGATSENRVEIAADLAERHDATLIGLAAGMWSHPVEMIGPDVGALSTQIIEASRDQLEEDLKAAEVLFEKLTSRQGIKTEWRAVMEFPRLALVEAGNAADLIVVGSQEPFTVGGEYYAINPGDVLMSAGRPLLTIPDEIAELSARNIVVAWKDVREARRVLADAIPVMAGAGSVILLQVREATDEVDSIHDAQAFLARHGVNASTEIRDLDKMAVEDELLQCARDADADLIVAGGYGRSRFSELVFGGVTRELLTQKSIACLFSH
jgi:nucleotide-binding universal stress UspA family protein